MDRFIVEGRVTEFGANVLVVVMLVALVAVAVVVYRVEKRTGVPLGYGLYRLARKARKLAHRSAAKR